ncbi:MAG: beta family protein [Synergistaceae bacterium]|nr:beta family protein [Synergistaceae bacterium]
MEIEEGGINMPNIGKYVPILKWKSGEQGALKEMPDEAKNDITPLIEILPSCDEYGSDKYSDSFKKSIDRISKNWGAKPFFLDVITWLASNLDTDALEVPHPYSLADSIINNDIGDTLSPIFVAPLYLDKLAIKKLKETISHFNNRIAIRIDEDAILESELDNNIEFFINELGISVELIDIIMDFQNIQGRKPKGQSRAIFQSLQSFPYLNKWNSITAAGTSFPETLQGFETGISSLSRTNWLTWVELTKLAKQEGVRVPNFADYGISGVSMPLEFQPYMVMSANIRYTVENDWLVLRGKSVRGPLGYEQYHKLCESLISLNEYSGTEFSWGDKRVDLCAKREVGPGNATTWRMAGTSHHIAFVLNQLANLP